MGVPGDEIKKALSRSSPLRLSGLIKIETENIRHRGDMEIEPMDGLSEALLADNHDEKALLRHFLVPAKATTLQMADYPHVRKDVDILNNLLKVGLKQHNKGVNILIYGTPGTGKTELAHLLAKKLKSSLFEVKTEDEDGDPIKSNSRLEAYRFCQQMLAGDRKSMILFDEIEDVFPARSFSFFGMEGQRGQVLKVESLSLPWIHAALLRSFKSIVGGIMRSKVTFGTSAVLPLVRSPSSSSTRPNEASIFSRLVRLP